MVWRHLPLVTCQCCTAPTAFVDTSTFFVRVESLDGRKRIDVAGNAAADPDCKSKATWPVCALKTLMLPSPDPAARYLLSGLQRTTNTSEGLSVIVIIGCNFFWLVTRRAAAAGGFKIGAPEGGGASVKSALPDLREGRNEPFLLRPSGVLRGQDPRDLH